MVKIGGLYLVLSILPLKDAGVTRKVIMGLDNCLGHALLDLVRIG